MDDVNNKSEMVQQSNLVVNSCLSLMNAYHNRHQIVMIPTPRIISSTEGMPVQSIIVSGTSTLHQNDMQNNQNGVVSRPFISSSPLVVSNPSSVVSTSVISSSLPAVSNLNSFVSTSVISSSPHVMQNINSTVSTQLISSSPPIVSNPNSAVSTSVISSSPSVVRNPNPIVSTQVISSSPSIVSNSTLIVSTPVISSSRPIISNSQEWASRAPRSQISSSPLGAHVIPVSNQTLSLPNTHQNMSSASLNPYADQRLASSSYAPQVASQVNSTSWRPHANMSNVLSTGNYGAMLGGSINQQHNYAAGTSNNNNGPSLVANVVSTPTNNQMMTGASYVSPAVAPTASIYAPIVGAPSQQEMVQTNAITQPPIMRPQVPSVYVQQLRKYIIYWGQRPKDNNIVFWRQFVAEFFAPDGKRKICFSSCQEYSTTKYRRTKEKPLCDICKAYSQTGHEISVVELPIFFQTRFNSYKDDKLNLNAFHERNLENNCTVLYFTEAIEQLLDDNYLTIQKGPLSITFNSNQKILSWQFCMRSCQKLIPPPPVPRFNATLTIAGNSSGASTSNTDQKHKQAINNRMANIGGTQDAQTTMINGQPNAMMNSVGINSRNQCNIVPAVSVLEANGSIAPLASPTIITNPLYATPTINTGSLPGPSGPTNMLKRTGTTYHNELHMHVPEQQVTRQRLEGAFSGNGVDLGSGNRNMASATDLTHGALSGNGVGTGSGNQNMASGLTHGAFYGNGVEMGSGNQNMASATGLTHGAFSGNGVGMGSGNRNMASATGLSHGTFSGNGVEMGSGNRNMASATGLTQGSVADNNIGSTAYPVHGSGVLNITDEQLDQFFDDFDPDNDISDLLEFFINQQ